MPHLRSRYLDISIREDMKWSPIVSVLGMRQVGKSTLLRQISSSYLTLDHDELLNQFSTGNWSQIEKAIRPLVIDEAQKCPGLFDRLKLLVDEKGRPGQFLLTGSVRFLSKKQIRESLTGRTSLLELLPLTLSESHSKPLFNFPKFIVNSHQDFKNKKNVIEALATRRHLKVSEVEHYLRVGGLPGICFKRNLEIQIRMRDAHLETLLFRDLQMILETKVPFIKLKSILQVLAQSSIQTPSASHIARSAQLSTPTVLNLLSAFEALFLIRSRGQSWAFTDLGLSSHLGAARVENDLFHMERFVYQELYAQLTYCHRSRFQMECYSTRGGIRIPFILKVEGAPTIAISVDPTLGATEKSLKGLTYFQKRNPEPIISVVLHRGTTGYVSSLGTYCIPYHWIS